jgi:hypothetical protein
MLEDLIASGRVVDVIMVFMGLEALGLWIYHRRTSLGPAPGDVAIMLSAGLCLLLALRAALTGANWAWIAIFLVASLVAHLADLRRRWWT